MHKVIFYRLKVIFLLFTVLLPVFISTSSVYAVVKYPTGRADEWEENNFLFYNPMGTGGNDEECDTDLSQLPGSSNAEVVWNWIISSVSALSTKPEAVAGILGNIHTETGGTFDPFIQNGSGCLGIFQNCGSRRTGLANYLQSKGLSLTGEHSAEDIKSALVYELEYAFNVEGDQGFTANLSAPTSKTGAAGARAYAELWLVKFERAVETSSTPGQPLEDPGVKALTSVARYQGAVSRRNNAENYYDQYKENGAISGVSNCNGGNNGGDNQFIDVDGYTFPISGATKSNYLHPKSGRSVLSPLPCTNFANGACHHDYAAMDMGIDVSMIGMHQYTEAELGYGYSDMYYYSMGAKIVAIADGKFSSYKTYSRAVGGFQDKCASITYQTNDGTTFWIGHLSYDSSRKSGDTFKEGDIIGEIGPPQCAVGTQSHIHMQVGTQSNTSAPTTIYTLLNKLYESIPD